MNSPPFISAVTSPEEGGQKQDEETKTDGSALGFQRRSPEIGRSRGDSEAKKLEQRVLGGGSAVLTLHSTEPPIQATN